MKILFLISAIGSSILFNSCKQENHPAKEVAQLNTSDTFYFEFPKRRGVFDSSFYHNNLLFEKALGLQSIEKGFDSIQIRLVYGGAMVGERLVVLINRDNKWRAEISKIITDYNPNFKGDEEDRANADFWDAYSLTRTIEHKTPKSGWDKFIKKLFKHDILTLPDIQTFADYSPGLVTDGVGVTVAIATNNVYRLYTYQDTEFYIEKHPEAESINRILELIDNEFALENMWNYSAKEKDSNSPYTIKKVKMQEVKLQDIKPEKKKKKK